MWHNPWRGSLHKVTVYFMHPGFNPVAPAMAHRQNGLYGKS